MWQEILVGAGVTLALYLLFVVALIAGGKRGSAGRSRLRPRLCRPLPASARRCSRPRRKKLVLAAIVPYLALPFDLVPDFVPVAGYLDDAVIVAFVPRHVLKGSGAELIEQHWPGPRQSLALILRLAGYGRDELPAAAGRPMARRAHTDARDR